MVALCCGIYRTFAHNLFSWVPFRGNYVIKRTRTCLFNQSRCQVLIIVYLPEMPMVSGSGCSEIGEPPHQTRPDQHSPFICDDSLTRSLARSPSFRFRVKTLNSSRVVGWGQAVMERYDEHPARVLKASIVHHQRAGWRSGLSRWIIQFSQFLIKSRAWQNLLQARPEVTPPHRRSFRWIMPSY